MFTIPDKDEGLNNLQSVWFQEYIDILVAGVGSNDAVISGCVVSPSANMTLAVAAGSVNSAGLLYNVAAANPVIGAAHATYARLDFVVVTSAGAVAVRAGTAALNPKPPAKTAGDVVLAVVYVPALSVAVGANQIVDMKVGVSSKLAAIVNGSMGAFGHRNKLINGKMDIAQRDTVFTDPNDVYTLDRWKVNVDNLTGAAWSVIQSTAAQDAIDHGKLLRYSITTVGSMTFADIRQPIEDVRTLQGKQVTVSFLLRYGTVGKTITARLEQNFGSGGSAQVTTTVFTATGSTDAGFTRYSGTVTLPSVAGKTIEAGNNLALVLRLTAPNAGDFVDVTHVQLEEGPVATPFEHRPIGTELALCQRYYEIGSNYILNPTTVAATVGIGTRFAVRKRAAPTVTVTAGVLDIVGTDVFRSYLSATPASDWYAFSFTASAEL
jgi:hypothetical protein